MKNILATGGTVGLAKGIIDDACLVFNISELPGSDC